MKSKLRQIADLGQSIWIDNISRGMLRSGELRRLVNEGVTGLTSNPTIFHKAISTGADYDEQVRELAKAGQSTDAIYEACATRDIAEAADFLRPIHDQTNGRDGYVSIEVNPKLAHDSEASVAEARRLSRALARPNIMIKVPATPEGVPAIRTLISEGIHVNVTLIFALEAYEQVMRAYVDGLRARQQAGKALAVASVASFFVSRVDTVVDQLLEQKIAAGARGLDTLRGQAAIANARIAYERYKHMFEGPDFADLRRAGAPVQRPLWASTSTKNPAYSPTVYVDNLIGPNTVNTLPPQTLEAIEKHAAPARTVDMDVDRSYAVIERLRTAGIRMEDVTARLLSDGVRLFAESFEKLLADVDAKRRKFGGR
jgi:transaldolase